MAKTFTNLQRSFNYKVKVINPQKKSDVVVKQLHQMKSKFDSVIDLRVKLVKELQQRVPNTFTFSVGYYEGQQHVKMAIESDEYLWLCGNVNGICTETTVKTNTVFCMLCDQWLVVVFSVFILHIMYVRR